MSNDQLPQPLPVSPLSLFGEWFAEARRRAAQPNPDAMVVATLNEQGMPSARVVLCKRIEMNAGYIVFFTNYESRKGRELAAQPRAAAVFHWDALSRQVRIEGPVVRSPPSESDEYFASRHVQSRVGAWASRQTEPLASREQLAAQIKEVQRRFGIAADATEGEVPRPPNWGGFRLWIESIELWVEGANRVHDRARWSRALAARDERIFTGGLWSGTRLNP